MSDPRSESPFRLLCPPYHGLTPVEARPGSLKRFSGRRGVALVWSLGAGATAEDRTLVAERPGGVALVVVLPSPSEMAEDPTVVRLLGEARPQGILPRHGRLEAADVAQVLRRPPADLGAAVTDYIRWRGIKLDPDTVHLLRRTIDLSEELRSITALSKAMYMSRRALGRRFLSRGLPVPSHWLQFGRLLRVLLRLQNQRESVFSIAYELGYPDGFSVSNQMHRLTGVRPSDARRLLGWEWFLEAWLRREAEEGGLAPVQRDAGPAQEPKDPPSTQRSKPETGVQKRRLAG